MRSLNFTNSENSNTLHEGDNVSSLANDAGYLTEHQSLSGKQDVISDLATIRSGAALGATAVQPSDLPDIPSANPIFCVNSGNVNSSGEGDLIGTANYNTVTNTNYTIAGYNGFSASVSSGIITGVDLDGGNNAHGYLISPSIGTISSTDTFEFIIKILNFNGGTSFKFGYTKSTDTNNKEEILSIGTTGAYLKYGWNTVLDARWTNGANYWFKCSYSNGTLTTYWSGDGIYYSVINTESISPSYSSDYTYAYIYIPASTAFDATETSFSINNVDKWELIQSVSSINSLSFKVGNTYDEVKATNGQGKTFELEEFDDLDLSEAANGTYNLFVNEDGETYALANTVYIQKAQPTMSSGDVWVNTSKYPYEITKNGTEGDFEDIPFGKITITTDASNNKLITSSETFKFNRFTVIATELSTVAYSGSYNDLSNKPTIPSYSAMTGADGSNAGASGLVPAPTATDNTKFLRGDGTWAAASSSTSVSTAFLSSALGGSALSDTTLYNYIKGLYDNGISIIDIKKYWTVEGSINITDTGIASGFSSSDYLKLDPLDLSTASSWELEFEATTPTTLTSEQEVFAASNSNWTGIRIGYYLKNGTPTLWLAIDYTNSNAVECPLTEDTKFKVKIIFTGTAYLYYVSINDADYTLLETDNTTEKVIANMTYNSIGNRTIVNYDRAWLGTINLASLRFKIENTYKYYGYPIPCKVVSTGSKVVDISNISLVSEYATRFGSALYYVIDTTNQTVSLPMGDIFGFLTQALSN